MRSRGTASLESVASQSLTVLQRLIHRMEVPVMAFDLTADHGCFGNAAMSTLMGIPWPVPQETRLTEIEAVAGTSTAAQIKQSLSALRSGLMRSYQGDREHFRLPRQSHPRPPQRDSPRPVRRPLDGHRRDRQTSARHRTGEHLQTASTFSPSWSLSTMPGQWMP